MIVETRPGPRYDRRIRVCRGCGSKFTTMERVAVNPGRAMGWIEVSVQEEPESLGEEVAPEPEPVPKPEPKPKARAKSPGRFVVTLDHPELAPLPREIQILAVEWWNVSRFSKHGQKAAWTEAAWQMSIRRLAALGSVQQRRLVEAGVEYGWQGLFEKFLDSQSVEPTGLAPRASAMQEAIDQWHATTA